MPLFDRFKLNMRFRSLESRIVTLFLVLIVAVQVIGLFVIQQGIDSNARAAISAYPAQAVR